MDRVRMVVHNSLTLKDSAPILHTKGIHKKSTLRQETLVALDKGKPVLQRRPYPRTRARTGQTNRRLQQINPMVIKGLKCLLPFAIWARPATLVNRADGQQGQANPQQANPQQARPSHQPAPQAEQPQLERQSPRPAQAAPRSSSTRDSS